MLLLMMIMISQTPVETGVSLRMLPEGDWADAEISNSIVYCVMQYYDTMLYHVILYVIIVIIIVINIYIYIYTRTYIHTHMYVYTHRTKLSLSLSLSIRVYINK